MPEYPPVGSIVVAHQIGRPVPHGMPLPSVELATPPTDCGLQQTTAVAAAHGPENKKGKQPLEGSGLETTHRSIAAMASAWLRRNVRQLCDGGPRRPIMCGRWRRVRGEARARSCSTSLGRSRASQPPEPMADGLRRLAPASLAADRDPPALGGALPANVDHGILNMKPEHETRRKIIREWMSFPKDKRQTEEQAKLFGKKAMERNPVATRTDKL